MASPPRTPQQLREHYDIEVELADRLRNANATDRGQLYGQVYDELYLRVPHHPQLTLSQNPDSITKMNAGKMRLLKPLLRPDLTFLEVGAGDAKLSLAVCPHVHQVYGLDVAQEITGRVRGPANFKFVHSTGCDVPLPDESVDLAYSDQVMEHIHPDDARRPTPRDLSCPPPRWHLPLHHPEPAFRSARHFPPLQRRVSPRLPSPRILHG
jgi:hypothetical protein